MERVDYTKRIPSNRKNVEYANTRVPENYDRDQIARHQFNVAKNKLVDFDRNYSGIGAFTDKLGNFYSARNQYSDDNDLGMDFTFQNPYTQDQLRYLVNQGYQGLEGAGDIFEIAARSLATLGPGEYIPGDRGFGGEWAESLKYDPNALFGFNPFYDEDARTELDMAYPEQARNLGIEDFETAYLGADIPGMLDVLNFQNYLRGSQGFDSMGLEGDALSNSFNDFLYDNYLTSNYPDSGFETYQDDQFQYTIPNEFVDKFSDYSDQEIIDAYNKEYGGYLNTTMQDYANQYLDNQYGTLSSNLSDQFNLTPNALENILSDGQSGDPLHMGMFEDLFNENTMPGLTDFELEYETPEAQALAESGYSDLPSMYSFAKAMKIPSTIGSTMRKSNNPFIKPFSRFYNEAFPTLSGSGGQGFPVFNFPSRTFTGTNVNIPFRRSLQNAGILGTNIYSQTGE